MYAIKTGPAPTIKKQKRIRVIGLKQLFQKKHRVLEKFTERCGDYYGQVEANCVIFIWGKSGKGKSEYLMQLVKDICAEGRVLFAGLEEKTRKAMKERAKRYLTEELHSGSVLWWDDEPSYELLIKFLSKRKSPKVVVIDSIQYLRISYQQYIEMKEKFPRKIFIINSHAAGKEPKGGTAESIRYDADIKVHVDGFIAFVTSRFGGNKNYVIWEQGARKHWNYKLFNKHKNR